jgi:type IV pilus assembly protein PilN
MRININLASNPYEVAREYTRRMGMVVAALGVLTVGLVGYILYQRSHTRDINEKIAVVKQEIAGLDAEKAQAQAILNQPQNRDVADQSQFLNQLFVRKSLSWTRVFTEMEKLMPPNIHVVSMKPEFNRDNQLVLHVVVTTPARDKAVELVKRMEKSPHFRTPQVEAENTVGEGGAAGGNIQFEIAAVYVPFAEDTDSDSGTDQQRDRKGKAPAKSAARPAGAGVDVRAQKSLVASGGAR